MAMTIGTNTASLAAARSLHESGKAMQTAMERLSSGLRINSASDDAAGMAVVTELEAQKDALEHVKCFEISNAKFSRSKVWITSKKFKAFFTLLVCK